MIYICSQYLVVCLYYVYKIECKQELQNADTKFRYGVAYYNPSGDRWYLFM